MSAGRAWIDGGWGAVESVTPVDEAMGHEEAELVVMWGDGAVRPERVTLLSLMLGNAVRGCPALEVMGARLWVMLGRVAPGLLLGEFAAMSKVDKAMVRGVVGMDLGGLDAVAMEDRWRVGELLRGGVRLGLRALGRRVSLLAYMLERGPEVRAALPCMEALGKLWGLRAKNKRSAICAAMMAIQGELDKGELRLRPGARGVLWYQKRRATRGTYAGAQAGNHNRKGSGAGSGSGSVVDAEVEEEVGRLKEEVRVITEEVFEMVAGVRVRAEPIRMKAVFAAMTPGQLRAHLDGLHEAAERRRLGV